MKRIIILLLTLFFMVNVFGQAPSTSKEYYLQKSKSQKTAGWVLLAGGTTMAVIGVIIASNDNSEPYEIYGSNFESGSILLATGLVADLVSIPFFISAAKNAGRAASISLTNQRLIMVAKNSFVIKAQPAVTVRIAL